jgi:UDP-3-O-[3-hydroxymyristoyl] glucosamine N-acyltransferase
MFSVAELANLLQLSYQGEGTRVLTRVSSWEEADTSSLVFLEGKSPGAAPSSSAGCVIALPTLSALADHILSQTPSWILPEPRIAFPPGHWSAPSSATGLAQPSNPRLIWLSV